MSTYEDHDNVFEHNKLKRKAYDFLKEYFKLEDKDIDDCDKDRKTYEDYPRPDFIIRIDNESIPVEIGNIHSNNQFGNHPGGINERLIQVLKKYSKLIHIPYPKDNIFGVPVYNVIIFDFKNKDLLPHMKQDIENMSKKLEEMKEKIKIIDKTN